MTNDTTYEYDIFISYNRADEAWAKQLATRLEQEVWQDRKLKVFFAPWDIKPGESIIERLEYALPRSRKVALIMSPESVEAEWVKVERYITQHIDITERQKRLIPLCRRACEIPAFLNHINYIDFQDDAKFPENYRILLATIKDEPLPRGEQAAVTSVASLPPAIPRPPVVGFVPRQDIERRRDLVERLKEELAPEKKQVVALWGVGGVGKTTLAAETARELEADFAGRVVWTSANNRADFIFAALLDEIAAQLGQEGLRTLAPDKKAQAVCALACAQPTLIVLDNFETISPDEKERCVHWLTLEATCPALITTREKVDDARNIQVGEMSDKEASEFLGRLIEQAQDKTVFTESVCEQIIKTAEANPYVMQWVYAQIDLADDPKDVFADLSHGKGEVAERVFDRSFNLPQLGEDGRAVLLALALFVPDASRDALAQVADFGDDTDRVREAIRRLGALRLIATRNDKRGRRLAVEGLTRSLAKARLDKDERADEFRQRFVSHFLSYAEAHAQPTPEDFNALEAEKDNLLGAMDTAFSISHWLIVIRFIDAINFDGVNGFLTTYGYWDEALRRGQQALKAAYNLSAEDRIAPLTHNLAVMYQFRGEIAEARRLYDESLEINKKFGNQSGIASSLHQLGWLAQLQGELAEAQQLYDESLEIEKKLGNQRGIALSLGQLGNIAYAQGKLDEARRLYDETLNIARKIDDHSVIAKALHQLAIITEDQGDLKEGWRLYNESLEIKRKLGDQSGIANTLHNLGWLAQEQGESVEARRLFDESLEIKKKLGNQSGIAVTLHSLAVLAHSQGELTVARRLFEESLAITKKLGDKLNLALIFYNLGLLTEDEGNKTEAVRLWREALSMFEMLRSPYAEMVRQELESVEGESS